MHELRIISASLSGLMLNGTLVVVVTDWKFLAVVLNSKPTEINNCLCIQLSKDNDDA